MHIFGMQRACLNPEHKISASDLAELARITIRDYPDYYPFYVLKSFTWNGIKQYNRNPLLGRFKGTDGLKTGHTEEAGYGLTASAEREGEKTHYCAQRPLL